MIKKIAFVLAFVVLTVLSGYFLQPVFLEAQPGSKPGRLRPMSFSLPSKLSLGSPTGVAIDTAGNLVVFHRAKRTWPLFGKMPDSPIAENTLLVFDSESGQVIRQWGGGRFVMPHGLTVDRENNVWLTDVGLHQVFKFNPEGKLLLKIGEAGVPGNDTRHFDQPTGVAVAPDGSFYVSDGYGNSRIMKFSPDGTFLLSWGTKGSEPGQFRTPHGIALSPAGNVYIADRENHRIQAFSSSGRFLTQWRNTGGGAVTSVCWDEQRNRLVAADDLAYLYLKHRGSDVILLDSSLRVIDRLGRTGGKQTPARWFHAVAADRNGRIFAGDILENEVRAFWGP